jgi:arabinofuranosyltransferase
MRAAERVALRGPRARARSLSSGRTGAFEASSGNLVAKSSRANLVWLGFCVLVFVVLCVLVRKFVTDDAFISVRYADNIANGHGFVWSPHGPRVEGFSNPLLVIGEVLAHLFGVATITAARVIGVGSGVVLLLVIGLYAPRVVGRAASNIALALVAFYPPLAVWAVGGLETLPATLVVTAGVLLLCQEPHRGRAAKAGCVFALLPWLRPEGIAVAVAAAALAELPGLWSRGSRREALTRLGLAAGIPLASQGLLELVRLGVYGHALPNSVIFKTGTGGTFDVLSRFAVQAWPLILAAAAGAVLARGRARLLAVPPLVYAIGALGTLNQVNGLSRFLLPAWPQLALLAGTAVAVASARLGRPRVPVAAAAASGLVAAGLLVLPGNLGDATGFASSYSKCPQRARTKAVAWLRAHTPADSAYSVSDAGLMAAGSGSRTVIDQLGLNEAYLQRTGPLDTAARAKFVLDRHPDAVVLLSRRKRTFVARYATDAAIAADPRFGHYALAHVSRVAWACRYQLFIYRPRAAQH